VTDLLYLLLPIAVLHVAHVSHLRRPGKVDMVDEEVVRATLARGPGPEGRARLGLMARKS
jgi:hypothetical protein